MADSMIITKYHTLQNVTEKGASTSQTVSFSNANPFNLTSTATNTIVSSTANSGTNAAFVLNTSNLMGGNTNLLIIQNQSGLRLSLSSGGLLFANAGFTSSIATLPILTNTANTTCRIKSSKADGATAEGFRFEVGPDLATAGAKIATFGDNSDVTYAEKMYINRDGDAVVIGTTAGSQGLVLRDNQATPHYWRVTISSTGVLTTTDLGTTAP